MYVWMLIRNNTYKYQRETWHCRYVPPMECAMHAVVTGSIRQIKHTQFFFLHCTAPTSNCSEEDAEEYAIAIFVSVLCCVRMWRRTQRQTCRVTRTPGRDADSWLDRLIRASGPDGYVRDS